MFGEFLEHGDPLLQCSTIGVTACLRLDASATPTAARVLRTPQDGEPGRAEPDQPARAYLTLIDRPGSEGCAADFNRG